MLRGRLGPAFHPGSGACFEAPVVVAGFDHGAGMGEAVEQRGGHLGIAEDGGSFPEAFPEGEGRGDDDRGLLVKLADQVEQELSSGLSEGQMAQLIHDAEVEAHQMSGQSSSAVGAGLGVQLVDQIHDVEDAATGSLANDRPRDADGDLGLACAHPAPVPVPPTGTTLRCRFGNSPRARSRTRVSLTGVPSQVNFSISGATGSPTTVVWYLTERAFFSLISAAGRSLTTL